MYTGITSKERTFAGMRSARGESYRTPLGQLQCRRVVRPPSLSLLPARQARFHRSVLYTCLHGLPLEKRLSRSRRDFRRGLPQPSLPT